MFAVLPWSVAYLDAVKSLGTGTGATVVYHGDKLSLDQAAFVNSAFGHGGEFDDSQLGSNTHSGAVIVPTVMALAERQKLSGQGCAQRGLDRRRGDGAGRAPPPRRISTSMAFTRRRWSDLSARRLRAVALLGLSADAVRQRVWHRRKPFERDA